MKTLKKNFYNLNVLISLYMKSKCCSNHFHCRVDSLRQAAAMQPGQVPCPKIGRERLATDVWMRRLAQLPIKKWVTMTYLNIDNLQTSSHFLKMIFSKMYLMFIKYPFSMQNEASITAFSQFSQFRDQKLSWGVKLNLFKGLGEILLVHWLSN